MQRGALSKALRRYLRACQSDNHMKKKKRKKKKISAALCILSGFNVEGNEEHIFETAKSGTARLLK